MVVLMLSACEAPEYIQMAKSMEPSILVGERLHLDRVSYWFTRPKRWDVILFRAPDPYNGEWAFRIVALPNEEVDIRDGQILINGEKIEVPLSLSGIEFKKQPYDHQPKQRLPARVPENSYFVLGDSPNESNDSRMIGFIRNSQIIGKLVPYR